MPSTSTNFSSSFFEQDTLSLARSLLGKYLINNTPQGTVIGKIVETEAYLTKDPASHAFKGPTRRNASMFLSPGSIYIYFIYGTHYCFNIVSGKFGVGEAVLIRALEPIAGVSVMRQRRKGVKKIEQLCNGPAKLVQALGINPQLNGKSLLALEESLTLAVGERVIPLQIAQTTRIGITKGRNLPYRFYIIANPYISKEKH